MAQTVFVGLSGGVDSAVSAALLKERGYNVVGAFIKVWSPEFLECTWKEDRLNALRVCAALRIPFREIDLSDEYKREVVGDMVANYSKGVTPNPDVVCNRSIKFGHFARWAFENGADLIATGHYARIRENNGARELLRAIDANKDQTYFLYRLTQGDLSRTLFPVGGYTKPDVRELAKRFDLPNAHRPDSQGLCFVGDVTMKDFLKRYIELEKGPVLDERGSVIGEHDGAALYTIGERHGFTVAGSAVHYVTGIDVERNVVRVSTEKADAERTSVSISDVHWIAAEAVSRQLDAQARYREKPFKLVLENTNGDLRADFAEPHVAAPGQSLVFYDGDRCLGGGKIRSFRE